MRNALAEGQREILIQSEFIIILIPFYFEYKNMYIPSKNYHKIIKILHTLFYKEIHLT